MYLHTILKKIFKQEQQATILSSNLEALICYYEDFHDKPYIYMMNRMLEDGYLEIICNYKEFDSKQVESKIDGYYKITGFSTVHIRYITYSVLYALGLIRASKVYNCEVYDDDFDDDDDDVISNEEEEEWFCNSGGAPQFYREMSDDDYEKFVLSKFDWNHDIEKQYGVEISQMTVKRDGFNPDTSFTLLILSQGKPKVDYLSLDWVAFDLNDKMINSGSFSLIYDNKIKKLERFYINVQNDLREISRIEFFAEYCY